VSSTVSSNLVQVGIRLEWQGLCLCDEFDRHFTLESSFRVLTLEADLNFPDEAVVALAIGSNSNDHL
jgi:hypothetical protein